MIRRDYLYTGLDKGKKVQRKIVKNFLPLILAYVLGAQKNRLIETVLLSTHNICFGREIRKLFFWYALLTKALFVYSYIPLVSQ